MIREEELQEATLDSLPCRAMAWMDVTRVEVLRKGETRPVMGLRTWRGVAKLENANAKIISGWTNRPIPYTGRVRIGEEEQEISANVFITGYRRSRPSQKHAASGGDGEAGSTYYIEFTGAGNLL